MKRRCIKCDEKHSGYLPQCEDCERKDRSEESQRFTNSMVMGAVLNNGIVGGIIGGSIVGGLVGDMLNPD